jgi:hypothetical protein
VGWWCAAALAVGFSTPGILLAATLTATLVVARLLAATDRAELRDRVAQVAAFAVAVPVWITATGLVYVNTLGKMKGNQDHSAFWAGGFGPRGSRKAAYVEWVWHVLPNLFVDFFRTPVGWPMLVLAVVGAVLLWRRDRVVTALLVAPLGVALAVAALGAYPIKQRLALWLLPMLVILVAEAVLPKGGWPTGEWRQRGSRAVAAAGAFVLLATGVLPGLRYDFWQLRHPASDDVNDAAGGDRLMPLLKTLSKDRRPGDRIVPIDSAFHRSVWYGHEYGLTIDGAFTPDYRRPCTVRSAREAIGSADRVWVITSTPWFPDRAQLDEVTLALFRTQGHVTEVERHGNAALYLVETRPGPTLTLAEGVAELKRLPYCTRYLVFPKRFG